MSMIADGQLAATATAILSHPPAGVRSLHVTACNVGGQTETVELTITRGGGTARRVHYAVLSANEGFVIQNLPVDSSVVLLGVTSNASSVDYTVSEGDGGPFAVMPYDANGALKSAAASIGSGNLTVPGDLIVSGGDLDLGASGSAGTLDVFPTTASKGKLAVSVTDQTGDTTVSLVIGAMAAARTITLPDPLAAADILTGKMAAVARTATADGTTTGTIADAGLLQFVTVTSDDANKIIVLPTPTPGRIVILHVEATGYELRSSTPASIAINGGTGASAESAIGANTTVVMICATATSWKGFQMGSDGTLAQVEAAA